MLYYSALQNAKIGDGLTSQPTAAESAHAHYLMGILMHDRVCIQNLSQCGVSRSACTYILVDEECKQTLPRWDDLSAHLDRGCKQTLPRWDDLSAHLEHIITRTRDIL